MLYQRSAMRGIPERDAQWIHIIERHATIRAVLLPEIVRLIAEKARLYGDEALDTLYLSDTGTGFFDDETGLYGQSAVHIFGLFEEEMEAHAGKL